MELKTMRFRPEVASGAFDFTFKDGSTLRITEKILQVMRESGEFRATRELKPIEV